MYIFELLTAQAESGTEISFEDETEPRMLNSVVIVKLALKTGYAQNPDCFNKYNDTHYTHTMRREDTGNAIAK